MTDFRIWTRVVKKSVEIYEKIRQGTNRDTNPEIFVKKP